MAFYLLCKLFSVLLLDHFQTNEVFLCKFLGFEIFTVVRLQVFGLFGLFWFFAWVLLASDRPSNNRFISEKERTYIEEQTKETMSAFKEGGKSAPWRKILTSMPAAAVFVGHTTGNWGTYLFLTSLPTYMKEVLKFDVKSVEFILYFLAFK